MNGDTYSMSKDFERNFTIEKTEDDNRHFLFKCKYIPTDLCKYYRRNNSTRQLHLVSFSVLMLTYRGRTNSIVLPLYNQIVGYPGLENTL